MWSACCLPSARARGPRPASLDFAGQLLKMQFRLSKRPRSCRLAPVPAALPTPRRLEQCSTYMLLTKARCASFNPNSRPTPTMPISVQQVQPPKRRCSWRRQATHAHVRPTPNRGTGSAQSSAPPPARSWCTANADSAAPHRPRRIHQFARPASLPRDPRCTPPRRCCA